MASAQHKARVSVATALAGLSASIKGTEVERMVRQRVGQQSFRQAQLDYWGGACAVTGIAFPQVLRASHAKPWAECRSDAGRLHRYGVGPQQHIDLLEKWTQKMGCFRGGLPAGQRIKKTIDRDYLERCRAYLLLDPSAPSPGWFWAIIMTTLLTTGMRRYALTTLRWPDVDLKRKILLQRIEGAKTKRELETPITTRVANDLLTIRERTIGKVGHSYLKNGQVFNATLFNPRYAGDELSPEQITNFFRRLSARLHGHFGLNVKLSPHRFRHTMATLLAKDESSLRALQEMLGHADVTMTMHYQTPSMAEKRLLLRKIDRF